MLLCQCRSGEGAGAGRAGEGGAGVACQSFVIPPSAFHCAHSWASVTFDSLHFCQLNISLHSAILGFRHKAPPSPVAPPRLDLEGLGTTAKEGSTGVPALARRLSATPQELQGSVGPAVQKEAQGMADLRLDAGTGASADGLSVADSVESAGDRALQGSSAADGVKDGAGALREGAAVDRPLAPNPGLVPGGQGVEGAELRQRQEMLLCSFRCLGRLLRLLRSLATRDLGEAPSATPTAQEPRTEEGPSAEAGLADRLGSEGQAHRDHEAAPTGDAAAGCGDTRALGRAQTAQWTEFHLLHRSGARSVATWLPCAIRHSPGRLPRHGPVQRGARCSAHSLCASPPV